jgi:hypothetical protein
MENNALQWTRPVKDIRCAERILNVLLVLRELNITPAEFLMETLGSGIEFRTAKDGFYNPRSNAVKQLLNVMIGDKRGKEKVHEWMEPRALDIVVNKVVLEMDSLKVFRMSVAEVTPEYLQAFDLKKTITDVLEERSPWLRKILLTAAQTTRGARENTKKTVDKVLLARYPIRICLSDKASSHAR